jgi:hypothetical protein
VGPSTPSRAHLGPSAAWRAYEELGVGVLVTVPPVLPLVPLVPVSPVSPSAPDGDAVALSVSVGVGFPVGVDDPESVGVGDSESVGDTDGDGDVALTVGVGDMEGDPVGVGDIVGVGVVDGDGVAQAGVGDGVADGARLGSSGWPVLAEVDTPDPATTAVVWVPVRSVVSLAPHVAEGLGLVVAPALDTVEPGPWVEL